jgi:hypothetical protein
MLEGGGPARESHFPRLQNRASDITTRAEELADLAAQIHDRLMGPQPKGETAERPQPMPEAGFVENLNRLQERTICDLDAAFSDLRSIAGEL